MSNYVLITPKHAAYKTSSSWQRDRAKLDIRKIMHKIGFLGHPIEASEAI